MKRYRHPLTGLPIRRRYAVVKLNGEIFHYRYRRSAERFANQLASANGQPYHVTELEVWDGP